MLISAIRVRPEAAHLSAFCFALLVTVAAGDTSADEPTPEPSAPQVAPASTEGENALRGFQLAADLRADLFAAEPMVANPVSFCLDERGRVFVCESFRQNAGSPTIVDTIRPG